MSANFVGLQKPIQPVTLALSERVNGWWPGVSRTCAEPNCGGRMIVDPPVHPEQGSLLCHLCTRAVAEVVVSRRAPYVPRMVVCPRDGYRHSEMARCERCATNAARRKRHAEQDRPERDCATCGVVAAMPSYTRCSRCRRAARKERAG